MSARFERMPGHLLRRCHQIAVAIFLDECARFDLTPLQFAVLESLQQNGPQDQATLGGAAALDRTTTSLVIRRLEERKLVQREKSTRDQRAKIVYITAAGRYLVNEVLPVVDAAQARIVAPLDANETVLLLDLLEKLATGNNALSRAPEKSSRRSA